MEDKPVFQHDCNGCVFLGHHDHCDLYFCNTNGSKDGLHATVIARFGDDGYQYSSGLIFGYRNTSPLNEACKRAIDKGLLTKEAYKASTGKEWKGN